MRFLLDHDIYAATARFLRALTHDVVTVGELGKARAADSDLLLLAHEQGRIFVTRDRDFGSLVYQHSSEAGVIYLRMLPSTQNAVHEELERVLHRYSSDELSPAFVVVELGRHRIRRIGRRT